MLKAVNFCKVIRSFDFRTMSGFLYIPMAAVGGLLSSSVVLAKLPKEESGLFFLCQGILPFILLFDMGLLLVGTREIAFASGRRRNIGLSEGQEDDVLRTFFDFRDARFVTVAFIMIVNIFALFVFLGIDRGLTNYNYKAVLICGISAIMVLMSSSYQSFLEGTGYYFVDRISSGITALLSGFFVAAAAYLFHSIFAVIAAWYLGQAFTLLGKAFASHRIQPNVHIISKPDFTRIAATFSKSFSMFLLQVGATLTKASQYPVISVFLGVAQISHYFFVIRITSTIDQVISVFNASQRANFSMLYAAGDSAEAHKLMKKVFLQILIFGVVAAVGISFAMPIILQKLSHDNAMDDVPFVVISVDLVAMTLSGMMTQFVIASGMNPFGKITIFTGLLTLGLLFLLVPLWGLTGAALSQFIANSSINLFYSAWHFWKLAGSLRAAAGIKKMSSSSR